ncbi:MAG: hypothetical protein ACP5H7_02570 [Minisyncoccia bacterium]
MYNINIKTKNVTPIKGDIYIGILINREGTVWYSDYESKTKQETKNRIIKRYKNFLFCFEYPFWVIVKNDPYYYKPIEECIIIDASESLRNLKGEKVKTAIAHIKKHTDPKLEAELFKQITEVFEKYMEKRGLKYINNKKL